MLDQSKALEVELPLAEAIELTDKEYEENTMDLLLSEAQFFNIELSLRHNITAVIGECMQLIEMLGLPIKQEGALKGNIKKSIWGHVQSFIDQQAKLSGIEPDYRKCKNGCDGVKTGCSDCPKSA